MRSAGDSKPPVVIDRDEAREPVLARGPGPDEPGAGVPAEQRRQHLRAARRAGADQHVDRGASQRQVAKRRGERHVGRAVQTDQTDRRFLRAREEAGYPAHPVEVAARIVPEIEHQAHRRPAGVGGEHTGDLAVGRAAEAVERHDQRPVGPLSDGGDRGLRACPADRVGIRVIHPNQACSGEADCHEPGGAAGAGRPGSAAGSRLRVLREARHGAPRQRAGGRAAPPPRVCGRGGAEHRERQETRREAGERSRRECRPGQ